MSSHTDLGVAVRNIPRANKAVVDRLVVKAVDLDHVDTQRVVQPGAGCDGHVVARVVRNVDVAVQ